MSTNFIEWNPSFGAIAFAVIAVGVFLAFYGLYRRLATRSGLSKARLLLFPKVILIVLLLLALLDPVLKLPQGNRSPSKLTLLLDVSSSMELKDSDSGTRAERATKIIKEIQSAAPSHLQVQVLPFDFRIHDSGYNPKQGSERGTDLAGAIMALNNQGGVAAGADAILFMTDGGDEVIDIQQLPSVPLLFVGVGEKAEAMHDLGIGSVNAPATIEEGSEFDIEAEVYARNGSLARIGSGLASVKVSLDELREKKWSEVQSRDVDLQSLRAAVSFHLKGEGSGTKRYRLRIPEFPGELTKINNVRAVNVEIQKRSLHVLYFTQELGSDYKYLRSELAADPGIAFTAMYRVLEDRFTIQGDRTGAQELEKGFPENDQALSRFDCIIFGSFKCEQLSERQMAALLRYVENGGAVVFLGGEFSFGCGGYAQSRMAPLFPWMITKDEPSLAVGNFPVTLSVSSSAVTFANGLKEALVTTGGGFLDSVNQPGNLRAGALSLLDASISGRSQSIIALQHYGKGQVLGVATNTLWRWSAAGQGLKVVYGKFWRQAIRGLTRKLEGGTLLGIRWDHEHYRPGEQALVEVRVNSAGDTGTLRLNSRLHSPIGEDSEVVFSPVSGQAGLYSAKIPFSQRGDYAFKLAAYAGNQVAENYERVLTIEPLVAEGANPELKEAYLRDLAARGKGVYASERDISSIKAYLREKISPHSSFASMPLVEFWNLFLILFLVVLVLEWFIRRRENLI